MLLIKFLILLAVLNSFLSAQYSFEEFTTSINGTIIRVNSNSSAIRISESGKYKCTYDVLSVTDEMRALVNFKLFENERIILTLNKLNVSDVEVTNSGKLIFYDQSEHFKGKLTIHVYSKDGIFLFSKELDRADLFELSSSGETIGIRASEGISIISLSTGNSFLIKSGLQLAIDDMQDMISAVVQEGNIVVYKGSMLVKFIQTDILIPRKVVVSQENNFIGVIGKYELKIFSLDKGKLLFEDKSRANISFRDLKIVNGKILVGLHKRDVNKTQGLLKIFDIHGSLVEERIGESRLLQKFEKINLKKETNQTYDPIPWPFFPFDSMRTVWNHYEQHMGFDPTTSYLHQGLDLITPIGEPTYSVIDGYVKCVLTLGGAAYWRLAVSSDQSPGWSDGWLSAHLIQSTIQFAVGDTVAVHDYLGDIVEWTNEWGHIHFVEIRDSGIVWSYSDNQWGINFNPALALTPYIDLIPPQIEPVFSWSKFAFAKNESADYLQPDSLFGQIDIIVKVVDYVGNSLWQQPAYATYYSIKKLPEGDIIKTKTLGHILNHNYPFYDGSYYRPYAGIIYQRDDILLPPSWMDLQRNFYHNLTNSNGDSLVDLSEKALSFNTSNFFDGDYRIIVEVYDESGNFAVDSMDVKFKNGNVAKADDDTKIDLNFTLEQNYPNPFNPITRIRYSFACAGARCVVPVRLKVFDVLGREVATLIETEKPAGSYEVEFNAAQTNSLCSGVYYYQLRVGEYSQTRKMILLR